MKIYTRTGDKGMTSLYNGDKVSKNNILIKTVGHVDHLSAMMFLEYNTCSSSFKEEIKADIYRIAQRLLDLGSYLATPRDQSSERKLKNTTFSLEETKWLEEQIDRMTAPLPPLTCFILPNGPFHTTRTITRQCETMLCEVQEHYQVDEHVMSYVNRLSDYFFTLARYRSHLEETGETKREPKR